MNRWMRASSLLVPVGAAFALGRLTAPDPSSLKAAAPCLTTVTRPLRRSQPPPKVPDDASCETRLSASKAEADALQAALADMDDQTYGRPIPWPASTPAGYRPAEFQDRLRRAIADCGVPLTLVDFDCDEAPCFAIARTQDNGFSFDEGWYSALTTCPAWKEVYGDGVSMASDTIHCPKGTESFLMFSSNPKWLVSTDDKEGWANYMKRFDARVDDAKDAWRCQP